MISLPPLSIVNCFVKYSNLKKFSEAFVADEDWILILHFSVSKLLESINSGEPTTSTEVLPLFSLLTFPLPPSLLPLFFLLTSPLLPTYFPSSSLFPSFLSSSFPHYLFSLVPFSPLTLFLPPSLGFSLSSSPLIFFPSCLSFLSSCPHSRISPFLQYLSSLSSLFSYFVLRFQLAPFLLPFHSGGFY